MNYAEMSTAFQAMWKFPMSLWQRSSKSNVYISTQQLGTGMFEFNIASGANDSRGPPCGTITSSLETSHQWPARRTRPPAPEQPRPHVPQRDTPTVGGSALVPGFGPARDSPASVQPSGTGPSQRPCQDLLCMFWHRKCDPPPPPTL